MDTPEWIAYQSQFDLGPEYFQGITNESRKMCVIVENRCHARLIIVIKNYMYLLQSKGWGLVIFHGKTNKEFLQKGLAGWPNVKYVEMDSDNMSVTEYSNMLCEPPFWRVLLNMGCHQVLMFQIDTVLLKDNVDDFLEYQYVGSGGLSLRNVWQSLIITQQCSRMLETGQFLSNEEIFFSYYFKKNGCRVPSVEKATEFVVNTVFYEDPCGMYQPNVWIFPSYEIFARLFEKRWEIPSLNKIE